MTYFITRGIIEGSSDNIYVGESGVDAEQVARVYVQEMDEQEMPATAVVEKWHNGVRVSSIEFDSDGIVDFTLAD